MDKIFFGLTIVLCCYTDKKIFDSCDKIFG